MPQQGSEHDTRRAGSRRDRHDEATGADVSRAPTGRAQQLALPEPARGLEGFRVRESARAKRMTIHVSPHSGVEVVVPRATSAGRVQRFVAEHSAWIERTRDRLAAMPCAAFDVALPETVELRALEASWALSVESAPGQAGRVLLYERAGALVLRGDVDDAEACRRRLREWLAAKGRTYLVPWIARLASRHGFRHGRIQVRGQKTRWGSCSSRGTLSLNYALLFLEPALVRYLMLHELAHTRVMAHDERFWRLLTGLEPRARQLDRQLNDAWRDVPGWAIAR